MSVTPTGGIGNIWFSDSNYTGSISGHAPSLSIPPLSAYSPSKSWDNGDDPLPSPKLPPIMNAWVDDSDNCSVHSCDVLAMGGSSRTSRHTSSDRSVMSDTGLLDRASRRAAALAAAHQRVGSSSSRRLAGPELRQHQRRRNTNPGMRMPCMVVVPDDDVSSLGGVEDQQSSSSPSLMRMALAIRNQSNRPSSLTVEEGTLWDTVQRALEQATRGQQQNGAAAAAVADHTSACDSSVASNETWESRYNEVQEQVVEQRKESQRSLLAMQRVLADATGQRDTAVSELKKRQNVAAVAESPPWQDDMAQLHKTVESKDARVAPLERELASMVQRANTETAEPKDLETAKVQVETLQAEKSALLAEGKSKSEQISELSRPDPLSDCDEMVALRKELQDKTSALESAKMIITSLEHASGSHAADMRNKLKVREDELSRLKADALDRQKALDSLAAELRECRRAQATRSRASVEEREQAVAVISRLEKNMSDIRATAAVFEATQDSSMVDKMSDLFGDSLTTLRERMEAIDNFDAQSADIDSVSSCSDGGSRERRVADDRRVRRDVVRQLEEELKHQREEAQKTRSEAERMQEQHNDEIQNNKLEIQNLRSQYVTILTVLARKERELAVLRDSLKVDDDVGYISDDASEADEEEATSSMLSTPGHLDTSRYGHCQTEALATLLAHGGGLDVGSSSGEVEVLKCQLLQAVAESEQAQKQLKREKESLANAKMIISSLEKANKIMREDLRSRLQDSNTAIASLLEKSVGSDKKTAQLKMNLENLKREKDHEKEKYRSEIERLRGKPIRNPMDESKEVDSAITETID
jgi:hypothetical protein